MSPVEAAGIEKQSHVQAAVGRLEAVVTSLIDAVDRLEGRLQPVIVPEQSEKERATGEDKMPTVPIAREIENHVSRLAELNNHIIRITERIEA